MVALSWNQVNAWRLSQHRLLERAEHQHLLDVVTGIGGLHAQLMSAAESSLWARVQAPANADVEHALWQERTLVKTWAMRGTLHLLTASEFPLYVAARSAETIRRPPSWYKYHGVTAEELDAIIESVPAVLSDVGITREQLAEAIAERTGQPKLRDLLRSGWGALLKPSAFRGDLCFGPSQGQNVTFVRPSQWLGEWKPVDPELGFKEMVRRYLTAYGPATVDDFAHWWGTQPAVPRKVFRSLGDEIEGVDVEGWQAWALTSTLSKMLDLKVSGSVQLLPNFDPYIIAASPHSQYILAVEHKARVYRSQGWISPVVLVDGRVEGIWEYDKQRKGVAVKVEMFTPPANAIKAGSETETERLGSFLGAKPELSYG